MKKYLSLVGLFLLSQSAIAEEDLWFSELAVGAVATSGNTEERNLKLRLDATRDHTSTRFKQKFHLNALNNSKDDTKTAQKFYGAYELQYKLLEKTALFARASYEDDRFSGFDYQSDLTVGYTRQLYQNEKMTLDGAVGIGARISQPELGDREEEVIVTVGGDYVWQLSTNAVFKQSLIAEVGSDSTISRSETSLSADVIGNLAMKLSLNIKHQTDVPVGNEKTDTETALTLVYKF